MLLFPTHEGDESCFEHQRRMTLKETHTPNTLQYNEIEDTISYD